MDNLQKTETNKVWCVSKLNSKFVNDLDDKIEPCIVWVCYKLGGFYINKNNYSMNITTWFVTWFQ